MPVDLRSDTFSLPTPQMLEAMVAAPLGDDVWGEDPTVNRLEELAAREVGKEAALFLPSGTMGNLIGVACQVNPGDEVFVDRHSHILMYEAAGTAVVAGVQLHALDHEMGIPREEDLRAAVRPPNPHFPRPRLLCLENTHNYRGGMAVPLQSVSAAAGVARELGLRVHLDGARLFNAAAALGVAAAELAAPADTVMLSLVKGLSAPVGGILAGDSGSIDEARRWRKRLGGGMRQAGVIAAAGIVALTEMPARLAEDHLHASRLARGLALIPGISLVAPQVTNIVIANVAVNAERLCADAAARGVLFGPFGPGRVRMVTYRGITEDDIDRALEVVREVVSRLTD
ncbi:MAG: threonine aldolase family protein [Candidatus Dormibacteria bacterium]